MFVIIINHSEKEINPSEKVLQIGESVMYSGKNPSALRSQQWLADSLVDLMKVKEFQYISVKEICQKADLTRQTFYQIFSSKEDVIRYVLAKDCADFKDTLSQNGQVSMEDLVSGFFCFFLCLLFCQLWIKCGDSFFA